MQRRFIPGRGHMQQVFSVLRDSTSRFDNDISPRDSLPRARNVIVMDPTERAMAHAKQQRLYAQPGIRECAVQGTGRQWTLVDLGLSHGLLLKCGDASRSCEPLLLLRNAHSSQTPGFIYLRAALASCRTVQQSWKVRRWMLKGG